MVALQLLDPQSDLVVLEVPIEEGFDRNRNVISFFVLLHTL